MESSTIKQYIFKVLVLLAGFLISWNFLFFKPYESSFKYGLAEPAVKNDTSGLISVVAGNQYKLNKFGTFWLGNHYRKLWALPVTVVSFDLLNKQIKLEVIRKGGGMQTTSFTLTDTLQNLYSLRSIDKDPVSVLPVFLRPTILTEFVRDQISATDPYAFLVVNKLANATGIYQEKPELIYIASGLPAFQKFGKNISGLYMFSKKKLIYTEVRNENEKFVKIYSTPEMMNLINQNSNYFRVDISMFLRCRLFDLLISDWDRHAGQWDWAAFSAKDYTVFRPLPKDRDQAFCYYQDGVLPGILTRDFAVRKFTSFTPEYEDVTGFCQNGANLDAAFLSDITKAQVLKTALEIQNKLTDKILKEAVNQYPVEIPGEFKKNRLQVLKSRRDKLQQGAILYFNALQSK